MRRDLSIDYVDAMRIAAACEAKAGQLGVAVSFCILDAASHPILIARMDGAAFQTPEVARGKALTAVMMRKSSKEVEDGALARLTLSTFRDGRLPIQGGLPVFNDGICVGSIGISGGTPQQDESIAAAGVTVACTDS